MTPPIVLLHAFPFDGSFWDPVRAHLGGYEISAPDLVAPDVTGRLPTSIDEMADGVASLIDPNGPALVAGCSMGGYVALSLALRHPSRVAALALIDTRAEADTADARAGREASKEQIRRLGVSAFVACLIPRLVGVGAADCLPGALALASRQPADRLIAALDALGSRPERSDQLHEITARTLVIVGENDTVTPIDAARRIRAGISGATLHVVPEAGHLTPIEQPEAVAGLIRQLGVS